MENKMGTQMIIEVKGRKGMRDGKFAFLHFERTYDGTAPKRIGFCRLNRRTGLPCTGNSPASGFANYCSVDLDSAPSAIYLVEWLLALVA